MRHFARLCADLDAQDETEAQQQALQAYLGRAAPEDAAWGLHLLLGCLRLRVMTPAALRAHALAACGLPSWLFDTSQQAVGDLAETVARVLPPPGRPSRLGLAQWLTDRVLPWSSAASSRPAAQLAAWWDELEADERIVLNQWLVGRFRPRVSRRVLQQAVADWAGLAPALVAQRLAAWVQAAALPHAQALQALRAPSGATQADDPGLAGQAWPFAPLRQIQPQQPFQLPQLPSLAGGPDRAQAWRVEGQYDGLRVQLVRAADGVNIWTQQAELLNDRFPEVLVWAQRLAPGTVLDGVLLVWQQGRPAALLQLQARLKLKAASRAQQARLPVRFLAFDILRRGGQDLRPWPLARRRQALEALLAAQADHLAQAFDLRDAAGLAACHAECRQRGLAGLVFKRADARYPEAAATGMEACWVAWPAPALEVDAVLVYARFDHDRRSAPGSEYTLAAWSRRPADGAEVAAAIAALERQQAPAPDGLRLLPFARLRGGLPDADLAWIDERLRQTVLQKFGPVRSVKPSLVLGLAFDAIARSARHGSGLAVQGARLLGVRHGLPLHLAVCLDDLQALLAPAQAALVADALR